MAQKEVTLKIQADVDDSQVQDLESLLQQIVDGKITIPVEANSEELEELNEQIEDTKSQLDDLKAKVDVDKSEIEDLEAELEELNTELAELEADPTVDLREIENLNSQISDVENSLSTLEASVTVDDAEIQDLQSELDELEQRQIDIAVNVNESGLDSVGGNLDELSSKSEGTESSIKGVGEALAAVAATAGLEKMLSTADNINQSWNRLEITLGSYGVTADQISAKQNQLTAATGRTAGQFREFANTMALAGVHSLDSISNAFYAASAGAQISGNSIETVTNSFQRMAMQGTVSARVLKNSGIEMEDLAKTLGVSVDEVADKFKSMTPEERLNALSASVKQADKANQDFANSWAGLKNQMSGALVGLMGQLGNAMLPTIASAARIATVAIKALTEGFKALPEWLKNIVGGIGAFVLAGTVLVTTLGVVGKVIGGVKDGLKGLGLLNTCAKVNNSTDCVGKLSKAWNTLKSGLGTVVNVIRTNVIPAMTELAATALANPYVLLALAIIGIVAALWYLYNTNEEFRNSVNQLYSDLQRLASGDWHVVVEYAKKGVDAGVDTVGNLANNDISRGIFSGLFGDEAMAQVDAEMPGFLENVKTRLHEGMDAFWNDGTQGFLGWLSQISGIDIMPYLQGVWNGFMQIPQWVSQMEQTTIQTMQGWLSQVGGIFNNAISNAASFGSNFVSQISSAARNAVSSFASGLSGLASAAWAEFNDVLKAIADFGRQAVEAARGIGQQITSAIWQRHSPGIVAHATFDEMEDSYRFLEAGLQSMVPVTASYSSKIVDAYNPNLNTDFGNVNGGTNSSGAGTVVNNEWNFVINGDVDSDERMKRFADYIIELMNWDNNTAGRTV